MISFAEQPYVSPLQHNNRLDLEISVKASSVCVNHSKPIHKLHTSLYYLV